MTIHLSEEQRVKLLNSDDVYAVMKERFIAEVKKIRDEAMKLGEEKGLEATRAIAKKLKEEKTPLDVIMRATGLTEEEIKGI